MFRTENTNSTFNFCSKPMLLMTISVRNPMVRAKRCRTSSFRISVRKPCLCYAFLLEVPWFCARIAHVYTIIMSTISDLTYNGSRAVSVTPSMVLDNGSTCCLSMVHDHVRQTRPNEFRSKTQGSAPQQTQCIPIEDIRR